MNAKKVDSTQIACIAFASLFVLAALGLGIWGVLQPSIPASSYNIIRMIMAVASAAAAGFFAGGMNVKFNGLGFIVTASLGFGVWLLFPFLFPAPSESVLLSVRVRDKDSQIVQDQLSVIVTYGDWTMERSLANGEVQLPVPGHIPEISEILIKGGRYRVEEDGPFKVAAGSPIVIHIYKAEDTPPDDLPSVSLYVDPLPWDEGEINDYAPRVSDISTIALSHHNKTNELLHLYLFDCWAHLNRRRPIWRMWEFPPSAHPNHYTNFFGESTGFFCVIVKDVETGKYHRLGYRKLFDSSTPSIVVVGERPNFDLE
ncbi:hypothetical protein [Novipirellula rosea]|uniref:hypothetical protein n=1 Tax=Novipirellula rosea TaxID=1031540 RepID=UPI0031F1B8E3